MYPIQSRVSTRYGAIFTLTGNALVLLGFFSPWVTTVSGVMTGYSAALYDAAARQTLGNYIYYSPTNGLPLLLYPGLAIIGLITAIASLRSTPSFSKGAGIYQLVFALIGISALAILLSSPGNFIHDLVTSLSFGIPLLGLGLVIIFAGSIVTFAQP